MPTEAEQIQTAIASNAVSGIQSASNDSGAVTKVSISEQIKAANHLAGERASKNGSMGLRFSKIIPPGGG